MGWIGGGGWTPHLDALAAAGVRFPAAVAAAPLTLPSHASIFSGLVPRRHGVHDNGQVLGSAVPLLAERLRSAGYATAAFVSGYPLQAMFGLQRGFDHYDDRLTAGEGAWLERPAEETTAAALAWIATAPRPWLVWVHYYDPHFPYSPPAELRQPGWRGGYDGEVAAVDRAVGSLLAGAGSAAEGALVTVFAGDHGESLGEHGEGTHGFFVYDSTMLVPMVWSYPGHLRPADGRAAARLVDVAPTLLDLLDLPGLAGVDGVSLVPALEGREQEVPAAYLETYQPWTSYGWAPLTAVRHAGFKLIAAPRPELYDLARDPGELENRVAENRRRARELQRLHEVAEQAPPAAASTSADPEVTRRLAALGYLGASRVPSRPPPGLADPKDRLALREVLTEADETMRAGDLRGALERFERVLAEEPDNRFAVARSGEVLLALGLVPRAVERLERAAALDPDQPEVRRLLAEGLVRAGHLDRAAREWMELVRLQPANAVAWSNLGATLGRAGKSAEAVAAMEKAVELTPGDPDRLTRLAFAEIDAGRLAEASGHLEEVADATGDRFLHSGSLGLVLLRLGRPAEAIAWLARARAGQPDFAEARFALAGILAGSGDLEAARTALAEALAAEPRLRPRAAADSLLEPLLP